MYSFKINDVTIWSKVELSEILNSILVMSKLFGYNIYVTTSNGYRQYNLYIECERDVYSIGFNINMDEELYLVTISKNYSIVYSSEDQFDEALIYLRDLL